MRAMVSFKVWNLNPVGNAFAMAFSTIPWHSRVNVSPSSESSLDLFDNLMHGIKKTTNQRNAKCKPLALITIT